MRRNRVQQELAETYGVSQSTVSRAISAITPLTEKLLRKFVPTAEDLDPRKQYIVDGTLLPCGSRAGHRALHSGKHKTTGMNVQAAYTLDGEADLGDLGVDELGARRGQAARRRARGPGA